MALDRAALKESAKKHFVEKARKRISGLIESYPGMIQSRLEWLNEVILAGLEMGVTEAHTFSQVEIAELVSDLSPLAELEMRAEIRAILFPKLSEKGFEGEILASFAEEREK